MSESKKAMEFNENTEIKLKGEDAAMVLREDGQMEIFFPRTDEDAPVKGPALAIFKLALVFKNPQIGKMLDDMFDEAITKVQEEDENPQTKPVDPADPVVSG
jgi:hypothetical protein